ncbi:hypothetical protein SprV_0602227600 [Sparganum proliferum]
MVQMAMACSYYEPAPNTDKQVFRFPTQEKATWIHVRLRQRNLLDYVLVWKRDQRDVLVAKMIPGADG